MLVSFVVRLSGEALAAGLVQGYLEVVATGERIGVPDLEGLVRALQAGVAAPEGPMALEIPDQRPYPV